MNGLRRAMLSVYSIVLAVVAIVLAGLAWNPDQQLDISRGAFALTAHIDASDSAKWGFTAIMAAVVLCCISTLLVAMTTPAARPRTGGSVRVRTPDGGTRSIPLIDIERILKSDIERIPEVQHATPRLGVRGGAIESRVTATVTPGASTRHVTHAISNTTIVTLREEVGVPNVREPEVHLVEGQAPVAPDWNETVEIGRPTGPVRPEEVERGDE